MLVIGGMNALSGAVIGVVGITLLIDILRQLESGISLGSATISVPGGTQELGLGAAMILILIFRRRGISGNREITWPLSRLMERAAGADSSRPGA